MRNFILSKALMPFPDELPGFALKTCTHMIPQMGTAVNSRSHPVFAKVPLQ